MTTLQMPAPSRSHEQRMGALRLANETRMARAELKRRIFAEHGQASRLAAARVLRDVPVEARRMKVDDLLRAVRGIGEQRSRRWRAAVGASTSKTVGGCRGVSGSRLWRCCRGPCGATCRSVWAHEPHDLQGPPQFSPFTDR
jgi:hypothetical protein